MNIADYRDRIAEQIRSVRALLALNSNTRAHLWILERRLKLGDYGLDEEHAEVQALGAQEAPHLQAVLMPAIHELGLRIQAMQAHRNRSWNARCSACDRYEQNGDLVEGLCVSCHEAAAEANRYLAGG